MPIEPLPYLSAFLVGLLGGVHCLGMCGGIIGSLNLSLSAEQRQQPGRLLAYQLAYNGGRIFSYCVAGALMGSLGLLLVQSVAFDQARQWLLAVAGVLMILLGFYLSGWWMVLNRIEQVGRLLWRRIEPLGRRRLPVRSLTDATLLGLLWGWLPCGLVYTMLLNASATGGPLQGAGLMLSFALGTLPNLLLMGVLTGAAAHLLQARWVKQLSGSLVICFGTWTLYRALTL